MEIRGLKSQQYNSFAEFQIHTHKKGDYHRCTKSSFVPRKWNREVKISFSTSSDDWGVPWMKPFSAEWDGFHCLQHSFIQIIVRPLGPAFLIPSIPVPFRHMYADSHRHNRRAPQLVHSPAPLPPTTMHAVTTLWKVTQPTLSWLGHVWARLAWCSTVVSLVSPACNWDWGFYRPPRSNLSFPAVCRFSCAVFGKTFSHISSPTILMLDLIFVPWFWYSFRGFNHLLDHKDLKQGRQLLATLIDVWLKKMFSCQDLNSWLSRLFFWGGFGMGKAPETWLLLILPWKTLGGPTTSYMFFDDFPSALAKSVTAACEM